MKKSLLFLVLVVVVSALVRFGLYPWLAPQFSGQDCADLTSGQVPPAAETRFLERLFADGGAGDESWLGQVSTPRAVSQLRILAPQLTGSYRVTWVENNGGLYQRQVQFDSGITVLVIYSGIWPDCPDLFISDEEIVSSLQFMDIQLLSPEDVRK